MNSLITASDTSAEFEQLNALIGLTASRLIVLSMGVCRSADDVSNAATELVRRLRLEAGQGILEQSRSIIVLTVPEDHDPAFRSATVQALRGIVQSVTREFAHRSQAINLLVVDRARLESTKSTLQYLDEPDGGYTAGFTFDITTGKAEA